MLRTTTPNCASKPSGIVPSASKPGMPETNSRSPVRTANESGGVVRPAGAAKSFMGAMGDLLVLGGGGVCQKEFLVDKIRQCPPPPPPPPPPATLSPHNHSHLHNSRT